MNWKSKVAVILGAFFLCALGVSRTAYAAPTADNCALLTPAQIQKVLGQPFGAPGESKWPPAYGKQPWGTQCQYASQKGPNTKVTFIVYFEQTAAEAKQTFDKLSMWFPAKSKPTIGDSAYMDNSHAIHVLKGKVRYYISIDPANEKQAKDLAASIAARI
ncbi:MAG TPA: hypothetical protein VGR94_06820 [Candidatus Acidoferrales bacterium]|nr:hypothetical protein [Candidatus Acidoferrales bacterium]HEV2499669.1 hypothetical protein [Terriglobia bacterium]